MLYTKRQKQNPHINILRYFHSTKVNIEEILKLQVDRAVTFLRTFEVLLDMDEFILVVI